LYDSGDYYNHRIKEYDSVMKRGKHN